MTAAITAGSGADPTRVGSPRTGAEPAGATPELGSAPKGFVPVGPAISPSNEGGRSVSLTALPSAQPRGSCPFPQDRKGAG
jgi:hypothetical protein